MLYCIPYDPSSVMVTSFVHITQEIRGAATGSVARAPYCLAWDRGEVPSLLTPCATFNDCTTPWCHFNHAAQYALDAASCKAS